MISRDGKEKREENQRKREGIWIPIKETQMEGVRGKPDRDREVLSERRIIKSEIGIKFETKRNDDVMHVRHSLWPGWVQYIMCTTRWIRNTFTGTDAGRDPIYCRGVGKTNIVRPTTTAEGKGAERGAELRPVRQTKKGAK